MQISFVKRIKINQIHQKGDSVTGGEPRNHGVVIIRVMTITKRPVIAVVLFSVA
jgi:hypothetical protein